MDELPRRPQLEVMLERRDRRGCAAAAAGYRSNHPTCLLTRLLHWISWSGFSSVISDNSPTLKPSCLLIPSYHILLTGQLTLLPVTDTDVNSPAGYGSGPPAEPSDSTCSLFCWLTVHLMWTNPLECVFHSLIEQESDDFYRKSSPAGVGQLGRLEDCRRCRGWSILLFFFIGLSYWCCLDKSVQMFYWYIYVYKQISAYVMLGHCIGQKVPNIFWTLNSRSYLNASVDFHLDCRLSCLCLYLPCPAMHPLTCKTHQGHFNDDECDDGVDIDADDVDQLHQHFILLQELRSSSLISGSANHPPGTWQLCFQEHLIL